MKCDGKAVRRTVKRKRSLLDIFLIPILIIVFVQGAVPFLTLIFSGIRTSMEDTMIGLDSHTVENRKVVLENDMIEQWSSVNKESDGLYAALARSGEHEMVFRDFWVLTMCRRNIWKLFSMIW